MHVRLLLLPSSRRAAIDLARVSTKGATGKVNECKETADLREVLHHQRPGAEREAWCRRGCGGACVVHRRGLCTLGMGNMIDSTTSLASLQHHHPLCSLRTAVQPLRLVWMACTHEKGVDRSQRVQASIPAFQYYTTPHTSILLRAYRPTHCILGRIIRSYNLLTSWAAQVPAA
jgi:hypothetical protein